MDDVECPRYEPVPGWQITIASGIIMGTITILTFVVLAYQNVLTQLSILGAAVVVGAARLGATQTSLNGRLAVARQRVDSNTKIFAAKVRSAGQRVVRTLQGVQFAVVGAVATRAPTVVKSVAGGMISGTKSLLIASARAGQKIARLTLNLIGRLATWVKDILTLIKAAI